MPDFSPRVSVLMPNYNQERYLPEAIQSILVQTFKNFEFIIVDDCSTDNSAEILAFFATKDRRIRVAHNSRNLGRGASRNVAMHMQPKGEYIAIMDSDDIALPERLERQVKFLDENPDIAVLGAQVLNVDEVNNPTHEQTTLPTTHGNLAWTLTFSVPFANPVVMIRANALRSTGLYDESSAVEDADLWTRLVYHGRFANLPEILLHYRMPSDRLVQRMADWTEPLTNVSRIFIEKLLNKPITHAQSRNIRYSIFNNPNLKITSEEYIDTIKLLQSIYTRMQELGLLKLEDITEITAIMLKQYRNLLKYVND